MNFDCTVHDNITSVLWVGLREAESVDTRQGSLAPILSILMCTNPGCRCDVSTLRRHHTPLGWSETRM